MSTTQQIGAIGNSVKVQTLPTASAATFADGNRFYTLVGTQEGYVTGHTYKTVFANDVYSWEDIAKIGDTGLTALEYGDTHTEQYEGDIADEPISLPISGFNRTPVVGDKFLLVFNVTESGNSYIAPFTITEVGTDTAKASLNGANQQNITGAAGTTDYNQIENIPVINQDLSANGFTPVANTYYRHTGTTDTYTQGVIYYYDGSEYKALDGSGGGGLTLNRYTATVQVGTSTSSANKLIYNILNNAKGKIFVCDSNAWAYYVAVYEAQIIVQLNASFATSAGANVYTIEISGSSGQLRTNRKCAIGTDGTIELSTITPKFIIVYYNDVEITA